MLFSRSVTLVGSRRSPSRKKVGVPVTCIDSRQVGAATGYAALSAADVVVAGGTDAALHPMTVAAFGSMRALSTRNDDPKTASRPWDRDRAGFVLGEGAGGVVLEEYEHAKARGADVRFVYSPLDA